MDLQTFYAFVAGTCFTLIGLWWNVVQARPRWREDETYRQLATGVYLSFLIPGLMSLAAQAGIESPLLWRLSFGIAALLGTFFALRISARTRQALPAARFHSARWGISLLYGLILLIAVFPGLAQWVGLKALTLESLLVIGLLLIGNGLSWEFLMEKAD
jgi:undecaprenyl pyrophosphate phosphatase UppP